MRMFAKMMLTALLAVTAENMLFAGGAGFSRALRAARRPACAGIYSLFVALFTFFASLAGLWLNPYLAGMDGFQLLRPAAVAAEAGVQYLLASAFLRIFFPEFLKRHGQILGQAAVNTVVLSMPFVQQMFGFGPAEAAGFALGTGLAFYLAALVLSHAEKACRNPDMPQAFAGLPGTLLYVGILSMAFAGFTGGKVF